MIKIRILSVGKNKETWLEEALHEYAKRLTGQAIFEYLWAKDDKQLQKLISLEKRIICLDPQGQELTSEKFSHHFFQEVEKGGSTIVFVIGGPDGLPETLKSARPLWSLSKLTFTHQMVRLILIEQIFRSFEIQRGSEYHR